MTVSQVLIQALDVLFIASAVVALAAIAVTWASMRERVRSLRAEAAGRDRKVSFSYTLIRAERPAARSVRTVLPVRRPAGPSPVPHGMRAAA